MAKKIFTSVENVDSMEAVVLAGGLGTRLRHVVSDVPKVLAPVGKKPFLDIILTDLERKGFKHIVLAVGYLKEQIIRHIENSGFDMQIDFSAEEEPLGTGGAIKRACGLCASKNVFVVNGDTFFDVALSDIIMFSLAHNADITVAAKKMIDFDRYGTLSIDGDFITGMREKMPCAVGYINGGIYCLRRDFILSVPHEKFSFERDVLEKSYAHGRVCAFISDGYFIDIGVPEDYERAKAELAYERRY